MRPPTSRGEQETSLLKTVAQASTFGLKGVFTSVRVKQTNAQHSPAREREDAITTAAMLGDPINILERAARREQSYNTSLHYNCSSGCCRNSFCNHRSSLRQELYMLRIPVLSYLSGWHDHPARPGEKSQMEELLDCYQRELCLND